MEHVYGPSMPSVFRAVLRPRDARRVVCSITVARNLFSVAALREEALLAPLPGCFEGWDKTGGIANAQPPATGWDASGIRFERTYLVFCFRKILLHKRIRSSSTIVLSPRSATARLHFFDQIRTQPPSSSGRGPTLQETASPRSYPALLTRPTENSEEPAITFHECVSRANRHALRLWSRVGFVGRLDFVN